MYGQRKLIQLEIRADAQRRISLQDRRQLPRLGRTDNPSPVGEEKESAPVAEGEPRYPPEYDLLDPEDQALIDSMIRRLILEKNQGDTSSPSNGAGSETA